MTDEDVLGEAIWKTNVVAVAVPASSMPKAVAGVANDGTAPGCVFLSSEAIRQEEITRCKIQGQKR